MVRLGACHAENSSVLTRKGHGKGLIIALAGNANVGKSVLFNRLTGSSQTIGNWPGKTVERAVGFLRYKDCDVTLVDLPGIYSLSTFSEEEVVTREFIAREKPDVIVNVVGAPVLERNLFFTLQLLELGLPMVVCLNQMDIAERRGFKIDVQRLEKILGVPVVPAVAARGKGIKDLVETAVKTGEQKQKPPHNAARFDDKLENSVQKLIGIIEEEKIQTFYPSRWLAIKLLEDDAKIKELVSRHSSRVIEASAEMAKKLEEEYRQPAFVTITSARYAIVSRIVRDILVQADIKPSLSDRIDRITTHRVFGYLISILVVGFLLVWTFTIGNFLSGLLSSAFSFFHPVDPRIQGPLLGVVWNGVFGGLVAGVTLVIPFVIPFYLVLALLEDSGILTRVAFMLDSAMHHMGLHGKAIIPIILGYGCNVPAIYTTRIMGSRKERILTAFAITFAPCAARTIIIMGMVAVFVGIQWALALYVLDILIMFLAVKVAGKSMQGDASGLIMEIHSFKVPSISVALKQTWARTKSLVMMVFPIYMIGTAIVQGAYTLGLLNPVNNAISFLTTEWLGLPAIAGILLIFGFARKELILLALVALFGTDLSTVLSPAQIIVLALVGTIYPCMATVGTLTREFGWKSAWAIIGANLAIALLLGGILARLLLLVF
ncbi:MAG: ferrous iron transport protein B [Dehalococcoidales bacterium]|jgi:ferrous iron transport protein B|nr:ferrous iron transport protein B [Dehalococcoidales bacterium]